MTKEDILKHQITAQYKNVSAFCEKTGIPESTVRNIFKRGFDGVGVRTAIKICHALSLDIDALMDGKFMLRPNDQKESVLNMYRRHPIDLDKVTDSGSEGWGFESLLACQQKKPRKALKIKGFRGFFILVCPHPGRRKNLPFCIFSTFLRGTSHAYGHII